MTVCAVTATADKKTQKKFVKSSSLKQHTLIHISPNRHNVKLHIAKFKSLDPNKDLDWLLKHVREQRQKVNKTIIYCMSLKHVSDLYEYFISEPGECAYFSDKYGQNKDLLVAMYHQKNLDHIKECVPKTLLDENGTQKTQKHKTMNSIAI